MKTPETKSLLPSLYKREELPLFGRRPIGPLARRAKRGDLPARSPALRDEGRGEIFRIICLFNYGLLSNSGSIEFGIWGFGFKDLGFKTRPCGQGSLLSTAD